MLNIDENQLIEFFGVLPTKQDPEEQEFFDTSIFDVKQDNMCLSVSFSSYFSDMLLQLYVNNSKDAVIKISLKNISDLEVIQDKPETLPFLRVSSKIYSESRDTKLFQTIKIAVNPCIHIQVDADPGIV